MKLSTRVNLLLYALILIAFISFLPPLRAYLDADSPLEEVALDLEEVLLLQQLDFLVTRQVIEYVDIVLVAEDAEELAEEIEEMEAAGGQVREVLRTLAAEASDEPRLEQGELENLEQLSTLYDDLCEAGDRIIALTQSGEIEAAFAQLREPMRLRREIIAPAVDTVVSLEIRAIGADLDRLLAASGRFAFLPVFEIESTVSQLRLDTDRAIAAALFAQSLERLTGEYIDVAFLGEPQSLLYLVRGQADQALDAWGVLAGPDGTDAASLRQHIEEITSQYQEFNLLGDRLLELAVTAERAEVLEFFEDVFEPMGDETLIELIDTAYATHAADARAGLKASETLFQRAGWLVAFLAFLLLTLALAAPLLMSRWIVKPVLALSATTKVWGEGNLSQRAMIPGGGELGELAEGLNRMAAGLQEAQAQRQRQTRLTALGELAGSVGHEIRNPLAIITNSSYFLQSTQKQLNDKGREHLAIIRRQIQRANRIITELLDFTREPRVEATLFTLREAAEAAVAAVEIPDSIRVEHDDDGALRVEADPGQIERCLTNLISNAVQAMPEGGLLRIEYERRQGELEVAVIDTGVGIPPEKLESIFEPLYTSKTKGIGLGLAVAQRYARINGGRLECKSTLGEGTTFCLLLPSPEAPHD
jgi:signal transduction histidine kinase